MCFDIIHVFVSLQGRKRISKALFKLLKRNGINRCSSFDGATLILLCRKENLQKEAVQLTQLLKDNGYIFTCTYMTDYQFGLGESFSSIEQKNTIKEIMSNKTKLNLFVVVDNRIWPITTKQYSFNEEIQKGLK